MRTYASSPSAATPQSGATTAIPLQGALTIPDSNNTTPKVNDARGREGSACLRVASGDRHVGDERNDDALQPDQGTGGRADDDVEVFPAGERCHVLR